MTNSPKGTNAQQPNESTASPQLTDKEKKVLDMYNLPGNSVDTIAAKLETAPENIAKHLANAYVKLGNTAQARNILRLFPSFDPDGKVTFPGMDLR